jgi:hypothetical protein
MARSTSPGSKVGAHEVASHPIRKPAPGRAGTSARSATSAPAAADRSQAPALPYRLAAGVRNLVLAGTVITAEGVGAHFLGWALLTATLGPTAYVFVAHPSSATARLRNAVIGHSAAVAAGLFALAVFGLWSSAHTVKTGHLSLVQVGAAGLALGLTLLVLEVANSHHAPAAATSLLVASGLARPGPPLYGLLIGLAGLILVGPLLARLPVLPHGLGRTAAEEARPR